MFIAFYRWRLKAGKEEQFRSAWAKVTLAIRANCGSLGSRPHQAEDGIGPPARGRRRMETDRRSTPKPTPQGS